MDIQSTQAPAAPPVIRREDYRAPDWLVSDIALEFDLDAANTQVRARLTVARNGENDRPLRLEGDGLTLVSATLDGIPLGHGDYSRDGDALIIPVTGDAHVVETLVSIAPEKNTQLMGLYASGGLLCTQCEPEGFRRITFFPDRPDVLSKFDVIMRADKALYPVLLANGDPVAQGDLPEGRHWARWVDPFPKPSYLLALVAGDLAAMPTASTTMSGREVKLGIWVTEADLPRTGHAMTALRNSMAWDEKVYGREYDLDVFTSSRSPTSILGRWRTRGSISSIRATSSPIPTSRPIPIMTRSRASWRMNISTTGRATASPAATGSSCP